MFATYLLIGFTFVWRPLSGFDFESERRPFRPVVEPERQSIPLLWIRCRPGTAGEGGLLARFDVLQSTQAHYLWLIHIDEERCSDDALPYEERLRSLPERSPRIPQAGG
jgi:hypothetical protein